MIIAELARGGERASSAKPDESPVTRADLEANREILARLRHAFPDDAILSEETRDSPERLRTERLWVVDPLDGTKEFVAGIPEYAVSIALVVRGEPAVAAVVPPPEGCCFSAVHGRGAWLEGERLEIRRARPLRESRVLVSRSEFGRGNLEQYRSWFAELVPTGSVALKLAWLAQGKADGWFSVAPKNEWDVCAGDLLVREAGGTFETFEGGVRSYGQRELLLRPPMAAGSAAWVRELRARSRPC